MREKLPLTLKKKWFDMIASGKKKEEYREIKPYWISRLMHATLVDFDSNDFITWASIVHNGKSNLELWSKIYDSVQAKNGYASDASTIQWQHKGIRIGRPNSDWCEPEDADKIVFILEIGEVIKL